MRITIVGGGPVGLFLACLLSYQHRVTILEKRHERKRNHSLNISKQTIDVINNYLQIASYFDELKQLLNQWANNSINTIDIENALTSVANNYGVTIRYGIEIISLDGIDDNIIIGADGARSKIRSLIFGDEVIDKHNVQYVAQVKYQTPGHTRPRLSVSAICYSFLNGLSGSDMAADFESLAPVNDSFRKSGTLYVPIPQSVYNILTTNGKGNFNNPWSLSELAIVDHQQIAKLLRIINRYEFSLQWRGGWFEDVRVTAIPLTIYRSSDVVRILDDNKLVMLCGDSSSGMIFERGLNKGWLETVKCAQTLSVDRADELAIALTEYSQYCKLLYESERDKILIKHNKIQASNQTINVAGLLLTGGLGLLFGSLASSKLI